MAFARAVGVQLESQWLASQKRFLGKFGDFARRHKFGHLAQFENAENTKNLSPENSGTPDPDETSCQPGLLASSSLRPLQRLNPRSPNMRLQAGLVPSVNS